MIVICQGCHVTTPCRKAHLDVVESVCQVCRGVKPCVVCPKGEPPKAGAWWSTKDGRAAYRHVRPVVYLRRPRVSR